MKKSPTAEEAVRTAGVVLFVALIGSVVTLGLSPTDSGQRGFGHGAVDAVCWLYMLWAIGAIVTVAVKRRKLTRSFWFVFVPNIAIVCLILSELISSFSE